MTANYTPTTLDNLGEVLRTTGLAIDAAHAALRGYTRRELAANPAPYEALAAAKAEQAAAEVAYRAELANRPDITTCTCEHCTPQN